MARTDPQVNIRMPQHLKDALELSAGKNKRTLTAETVVRLEGPSALTAYRDQVEKVQTAAHYQMARFQLQALYSVAQMVINEVKSEPVAPSLRLLKQVLSMTHLPPASDPMPVKPEQLSMDSLQESIIELKKLADGIDSSLEK